MIKAALEKLKPAGAAEAAECEDDGQLEQLEDAEEEIPLEDDEVDGWGQKLIGILQGKISQGFVWHNANWSKWQTHFDLNFNQLDLCCGSCAGKHC